MKKIESCTAREPVPLKKKPAPPLRRGRETALWGSEYRELPEKVQPTTEAEPPEKTSPA